MNNTQIINYVTKRLYADDKTFKEALEKFITIYQAMLINQRMQSKKNRKKKSLNNVYRDYYNEKEDIDSYLESCGSGSCGYTRYRGCH